MATNLELSTNVKRGHSFLRDARILAAHEEEIMDGSKNSKAKLNHKFLRIKFQDTQLESVYKKSVYRQRQQLFLNVCTLFVFLAVVNFVIFFASDKVVMMITCIKCVNDGYFSLCSTTYLYQKALLTSALQWLM